MSHLKDDLTAIDGVGDVTADKILAILPAETGEHDPYIDKAIDAATEGDDRRAAVYLRRANSAE